MLTHLPTRIKLFLLLLVSIQPLVSTSGQNFQYTGNLRFEHFQIRDGLPDNSIMAITQDQNGYIWLGTQNGLVRYDGYDFQKVVPSEEESFFKSPISALYEDSRGYLWIGTHGGGLTSLNLTDGHFSTYRHTPNMPNSISSNTILSINEDGSGAVCIGTNDGFNRLLPKQDSFVVKTYYPAGIPIPVMSLVDSLNKAQNLLAGFFSVENNQDLKKSFTVSENTRVLVHVIGQKIPAFPNGFSDYGWISDAQGNHIWEMDLEKTYDAESSVNGEYRQQAAVIELAPGTYTLHYLTNGFGACDDRGSNAIKYESYYGIQLFEINAPIAKRINNYLNVAPPETSILEQVIESIITDENGITWLGGGGGITRMKIPDLSDPQRVNFSFSQPLPIKNSLGPVHVFDIAPSKKGGIWIAGLNNDPEAGGELYMLLSYYDPVKNIHQELRFYNSNNITLTSLIEDDQGNVWIGTAGQVGSGGQGVIFIDKETAEGDSWQYLAQEEIKHYNFEDRGAFWSIQNHIEAIYQDFSGAIWLGTRMQGLFKLGKPESQIQFFPLQGETDIQALCFFETDNESIWIGTQSNGLLHYDYTNDTYLKYEAKPNDLNSISNNTITDIIKDKSEKLWVSTGQGGLNHFDPVSKIFKQYHLKSDSKFGWLKKTPLSIDDLALTQTGQILLSTNHGIFYFNPETKEFSEFDKNYAFQAKKWRRNNTIIHSASNGKTFVGTLGQGISVFDENNKKEASLLEERRVTDIVESQNGILWVGTANSGLFKVNLETYEFIQFTENDGLIHNYISGIILENDEAIWLLTPQGLSRFKENSKTFANYGVQEGVILSQKLPGKGLLNQEGAVIVSGTNGFYQIKPGNINRDTTPPKVVFSNFSVSNDWWSSGILDLSKCYLGYTKRISLKHDQNDISLQFTGLHFDQSSKNLYRYRLLGYDKTWSQPSNSRIARYTNLPYGTYTFLVSASNSDGIWTKKPKAVNIVIGTPWWQTWWAKGLFILLIGFTIYQFYRIQLKRRLDQAETQRLRELDAAKTQLYTNITHEFRTPLTIILGIADQIKGNPQKWLHKGLDMIQRNGESLLNLVNQLLELARLETGHLSQNNIQDDIIAYLKYLLESFHSYAAQKNIQLHFLSEQKSLIMDFDPDKLMKIFSNILSNAIKFTPENGHVYLGLSNNNPNWLKLSFRDTGIGIPEDQLERIFDRFHQVDSSSTRENEGAGIGLALTKELVQLIGGKISVESQIKTGTTITIELPVERVMETEVATSLAITPQVPAALSQKAPVGQGKNTSLDPQLPLLLLVEDNLDVVQYLQACLEDQYRLLIADNGAIGIKMAFDSVPDLIISDIMMPEADGYTVCSTLKQDPRTSHVPIILLTAKGDQYSKITGLDQGADAYLSKPFHQPELLVRIKKLLELRGRLQQYYLSIGGSAITHLPVNVKEKEKEFITNIRTTIEENLLTPDFKVDDLCRKIGMSHAQLHRKLKALTNLSTNQFIRVVKLQKAKSLLVDPDQSIADIAFDCGFNDPDYFTKVFKKEEGCTPTEYRNRALKLV